LEIKRIDKKRKRENLNAGTIEKIIPIVVSYALVNKKKSLNRVSKIYILLITKSINA
jgi:hypothetical protein